MAYKSTCIPALKIVRNNVETTINDQKEIEKETVEFYGNLYSNKDEKITINSIEGFLGRDLIQGCPKITEHQKAKMEGLITVEELTKYIKKCRNNAAPGTTGFTGDFFKFFWRDLKLFVCKSVNFSYENDRLSVSQRLGIITLIPKGDKDKLYLKNWRPLTLLNTLYKLVSGCIAERIKPCLETIIHADQKGFVPNRYIGESIRTTYDILDYAKTHNKTGLLLLIDFEKAYDSVSFNYIKKCLAFFNFGESLIRWVGILLQGFSAVINLCGNVTNPFNISRGCRQVDPIASFLFIICVEVLAHMLRTDGNEKRI